MLSSALSHSEKSLAGERERMEVDSMEQQGSLDKAQKSEKNVKGIRFAAEDTISSPDHSTAPAGTEYEISPLSDASKTPLRFNVPNNPQAPTQVPVQFGEEALRSEAEIKADVERGRGTRRAKIRTREKTPFSPRTFARLAEPGTNGGK